jgi:hypothetical protein
MLSLLVLGLFALWFNKGFYYADYQSGIILQFPETTQSSFFDQFSGAKYVSKVNRDAKQVRYQGLTIPQVNAVVQSLEIKPTSIIEQSQILPVNTTTRVVWIGLITVFVSSAYIYYSIIRKFKGIRTKLFGLTVFKLLGLGLGILTYLGLISLISRVYQLNDTTLLGVLISGLIGLVVVYISLQNLLNYETHAETIYELEMQTVPFTKLTVYRIWRIAALIILFVAIGMGVNFGFDALLIFIGIVITIFSVLLLPEFLNIAWHLEWNKLLAPTLDDSITISESEVNLPQTSPKKSAKKKTKPKIKRRR